MSSLSFGYLNKLCNVRMCINIIVEKGRHCSIHLCNILLFSIKADKECISKVS